MKSQKISKFRFVSIAAFCLIAMFSGYCFSKEKPLKATVEKCDQVKVDKSERRLYLMKGDNVIKEFRVALGRRPVGRKECRGDKRTPEGEYTLDYEIKDSSYYKSIHIDYPNAKDKKRAGRKGCDPGGDICLHGIRNGLGWLDQFLNHFNWTAGCIAVTNSEIDEILELVTLPLPVKIRP